MNKITFLEFKRVMACELSKKREPCIEMCFQVVGCADYEDSWMGKMKDRHTGKDVYWFGLVPDGSQGYDFSSFEDFANAKIFCGKNLREIWSSVLFICFDGGQIDETLPYLLGLSQYHPSTNDLQDSQLMSYS